MTKKTAPRQEAPHSRADDTQARERHVQHVQDLKDSEQQARQGGKQADSTSAKAPVQAGAREQPSRFPAQHLVKPGEEGDLATRPRFRAPDYRGSGKLEGMAAIVTGATPASGARWRCSTRGRGPTSR